MYPTVSLATARAHRDAARSQLAAKIDPAAARRTAKQEAAISAATNFEAVAREWWERKHSPEVVPAHADRNLRRLEKHLFPSLGKRPMGEITPNELLIALQLVIDHGKVETAHRLRIIASQIFQYAIPSGRASRDIAGDIKNSLQRAKTKHRPAIIDPKEFGILLAAINDNPGRSRIVWYALKLAPLLFVRPGEFQNAEWKNFRLNEAEWDYPPASG